MQTRPESVINFPGGFDFHLAPETMGNISKKEVLERITKNASHVTTYHLPGEEKLIAFHEEDGTPLEIKHNGKSYEIMATMEAPSRREHAIYDTMDACNLIGYNAEFRIAGNCIVATIEDFPQDTGWF